jgi:AAA+ ATPase superfamily predicted ATPase
LAETETLRNIIAKRDFGRGSLAITGRSGVGKSFLLKSVVSEMPGVTTVRACHSDSRNDIVRKVLNELTGIDIILIIGVDIVIKPLLTLLLKSRLIFEAIKQIMHRKIKNIVSILRKTKLKLC